MIDISKILAGWISSWVENDLGGFRLGEKVWVDFGGWKMARWILAEWISTWMENDLGGFCLGGKGLKVWVDFGGLKTLVF